MTSSNNDDNGNMHGMEKQQKHERHTVRHTVDMMVDFHLMTLTKTFHLSTFSNGKKSFYETKVVVTPEQATQIEQQTRNQ